MCFCTIKNVELSFEWSFQWVELSTRSIFIERVDPGYFSIDKQRKEVQQSREQERRLQQELLQQKQIIQKNEIDMAAVKDEEKYLREQVMHFTTLYSFAILLRGLISW